jgi:hypothetical protein
MHVVARIRMGKREGDCQDFIYFADVGNFWIAAKLDTHADEG